MPLKDSTETKKMGCQKDRGGRMGSWSNRNIAATPKLGAKDQPDCPGG
jgi:hypothetical protein